MRTERALRLGLVRRVGPVHFWPSQCKYGDGTVECTVKNPHSPYWPPWSRPIASEALDTCARRFPADSTDGMRFGRGRCATRTCTR
eukprot:32321-Prorocentrum_minimum.AAC.2